MALIQWLQDVTLEAEDAETGKFQIQAKKGEQKRVTLRRVDKATAMTYGPPGTIDCPEVTANTTDFMVLEYNDGDARPA